MPIPPFLDALRRRVGTTLLLLPGVAGVVPDERGRVLCMRRSDTGRWGLPSGIVEPGEDPAATIAREIHEETGIVARPTRILAVSGGLRVTYPNGDECEFVSTVYACERVGGVLEALDGEALELGWFDPAALPRPFHLPHLPAPLSDLLRGSGARFSWDEAWLPGVVASDAAGGATVEGAGTQAGSGPAIAEPDADGAAERSPGGGSGRR